MAQTSENLIFNSGNTAAVESERVPRPNLKSWLPPEDVSYTYFRAASPTEPALRFSEPSPDVINPRLETIKQTLNGVVLETSGDEFTARLEDATFPDNPDEIVTLSLEDVDSSEHDLVTPGASFVWYIGYVSGATMTKHRFSKIRFRRLPPWSTEEVSRAMDAAMDDFKYFHRD